MDSAGVCFDVVRDVADANNADAPAQYVKVFTFISIRGPHARCKCDLGSNVCFFFSSRRRHTRFKCDWSSDVCSSDLLVHGPADPVAHVPNYGKAGNGRRLSAGLVVAIEPMVNAGTADVLVKDDGWTEIGRASCRERV